MATRTSVSVLCDPCLASGTETDAETLTVGGYNFDVCAKHRKALTAFEDFANKHGQRVKSRRYARRTSAASSSTAQASVPDVTSTAEQLTCGKCGKTVKRGSRYSHAKTQHGMPASRVEWSPVQAA